MQYGSEGVAGPPAATFVDYGALLRRHWLVVLAGVVVGAVAGVLFLILQPSSYTSTTTVLVRSAGLPNGSGGAVGARTTGEINLDTEAQIARSAKIAGAVRTELDGALSAQELASRLTLRVPPNSEVLVFEFVADDAALARKGSAAFAMAYLDAREESAATAVEARRAGLEAKLGTLGGELNAAIVALTEAEPASREQALAAAARDSVLRRQAVVAEELAALDPVDVTPGEIITPATEGASDTAVQALIALTSGTFLGLLLGLGLAMVRDRTSHRLRASDVARMTSHPVIARVPRSELHDTQPGAPRSHKAAITRLRNVVLHSRDPLPHTFLVAEAGRDGVASELAGQLALSLAKDGLTVALMPAAADTLADGQSEDVRAPDLTRDWATTNPTVPDTLSVVEPGSSIDELREDHEYVIAHVAGTEQEADAQTLAPCVDLFLLVVDERWTRRQHLRDALAQVDSVGATSARLALVVVERERRRWRRPLRRSATSTAVLNPTNRPEPSQAPSLAAVRDGGDAQGRGPTTANGSTKARRPQAPVPSSGAARPITKIVR